MLFSSVLLSFFPFRSESLRRRTSPNRRPRGCRLRGSGSGLSHGATILLFSSPFFFLPSRPGGGRTIVGNPPSDRVRFLGRGARRAGNEARSFLPPFPFPWAAARELRSRRKNGRERPASQLQGVEWKHMISPPLPPPFSFFLPPGTVLEAGGGWI